MRSRVLRLSAATLLLGAAATTMAPHLTSYISSSAVVNAPVLTLRAPFAGVLADSSPGLAAPVRAGQVLLRLDGERQDQDGLAALQAEVAATRAEIAGLSGQIATMTRLKEDLRERVSAQDEAMSLALGAERRRLRAVLRHVTAEVERAEAERDRVARLVEVGSAPQAMLDDSAIDARIAQSQVEEVAAELEGIEVTIRSLGHGIAVSGAAEAGTYARQQLDQVVLQLAGLTSRSIALHGRLGALERQVVAVGADFVRRNTFSPEAAVAGVVWRAAPAPGTSAMAGDTLLELLDCQNRFVEVALPARLSESIHPGDPATIHLKGASRTFEAHIEAVGGAGARFDHPSLASNPAEIAASDIQILVRLDPVDPSAPGVAVSFCDVGRTAEVRFDRDPIEVLDNLSAIVAALSAWGRDTAPPPQDAGPGERAIGAS